MSDEKYVSLLFRHVDNVTFHTYLIDTLCQALFVSGIVGNILGLFLFSSSRRSRRISSTYVALATSSSIANLLCVLRYAPILHSTTRNVLRDLVGQTRWGCKFYEFSFAFRVVSSWITLFWMFERVLCVSTTLRSFFDRCKACHIKYVMPVIIILLILSVVIGPPVYMFEPFVRRLVLAKHLCLFSLVNESRL